jgi:hypothetical protein
MVMLKTLAPDYPAPFFFRVADNEGELAAVGLGFRLNALSFFFFEFTAILRLLFVVNAVKVLADNLTIFRFRRLFEAFRKGPVLQADKRCFSRIGKFSFLAIEAVARRKRSSSLSQLSSKLDQLLQSHSHSQ